MRSTRSPVSASFLWVSITGRPAPTVASKRIVRPASAAVVSRCSYDCPRSGQRPLVGQHDVEAAAERGQQHRAGLVAGHVHQHRPRHGVARHEGQRVGGGGRRAADGGQHAAGVLGLGQLSQSRQRQPAGVEHVAGAIEQADDAHRVALGRLGHQLGKRPADAAEAEQHDVGGRPGRRPAAADLRELERGVHLAGGLGGVFGGDDERDVALRRALGDGDDVDAAGLERGEDPGGDARACRPCRRRPRRSPPARAAR